MSGVPAKPFQWATLETNFPAGAFPWSSQPIKVAPISDYVTPGDSAPAENFNYILNKLSVDNKTLHDYVGSQVATNWPYLVDVTQFTAHTSLGVDRLFYSTQVLSNAWLLFSDVTGVKYDAYKSVDEGQTWTVLGNLFGVGAVPTILSIAESANEIVAGLVNANNASCTLLRLSAGTWTAVSGLATVGTSVSTFTCNYFNSLFVFSGLTHTGAGAISSFLAHSTNGTSWTVDNLALTAAGVTGYLSAASPSKLLVFTIRAGHSDYSYTTDGSNWNSGTVTASATNISSVDYDSTRGLFVVNTGDSNTYTSPDGINWTSVAAFNLPVGDVLDFACFGSLWIAIKNYVLYYSQDAGLTWTTIGTPGDISQVGTDRVGTATSRVSIAKGRLNYALWNDSYNSGTVGGARFSLRG